VAALAVVLGACAREIRPEPPRDLQAYAGEPLTFETAQSARGTQYEWLFGDESATVRGPRAAHAFARSGRYTVRAMQRGQSAATFQVTVLPRPVLNAVPPDARAVVFVPRARDLVVAMEFLNRAVGSLLSDEFVDREPLLRYGLSMRQGASASELGLDDEEGLAVFRLAQGGWIAAAGIADESKALAAARRVFEERGFRAGQGGEGTVILHRGRDRIIGLVDRGYLYLASSPGEDAVAPSLTALRQRITAIPSDGISRDPLLAELRTQVPEGQGMVFWRENEIDALRSVHSGLAALRFVGDAMEIDGRLHADRPLWDQTRSPRGLPLERGAEGPVLALSASVAPEELARFVRGRHASAREIDEAARVLAGDLALTAYFDAGATARAMRNGPRPSAVAGTLIAHAGIRDRAAATRLAESALERNEIRFKKRSARDATAFSLEWFGRPTTIEITDRHISLEAGEPLRDRQGIALAESLQARFVPASFGVGHVSFVVDVGQVAKELDPGPFGRGGGSAAPVLGFLSALVRQATAVETIFMDVVPDARGGALRGRVTLRPR
jgi:hypothetical protein